jgi:pilus assembly protein CpaB
MGRRTLLLIASVLVAALGTSLLWLWADGADRRARSRQRPVNVYTALKDIPANTKGAALAALVQVKQVPAEAAAENRISSLQQVAAQVTTQRVFAGQQLITAQFGATIAAGVVPANQMAMAVTVQDPNRVAPLLKPGAEVAIYLVTGGTGQGGPAPSARLLLPKVRVLATGDQTAGTAAGDDRAAVAGAVVTLAVTGRQATTLMYGLKTGEFYFTLLGPGASASATDDMTRVADLYEGAG